MASEDVKEPDKNSESSPAAHLATAKKVLKRLRAELKDAAPEDLDDSDVVNLRRKFIHECERAMVAEELRRDVYGYLWRDAFYSTLFIYRGAWKLHNGLNSKQKEELRSFVSKAVRYLLKLRKTHRDLAYFIFLNVGDMYRYCFDVLREEEHIKNALKFYGQALAVKPGDGHPFNQLGILYREQNPWKAASMFLRSSIVSSPYDKAEENFLLLRATGFMENLKQNTWEYVYGMFDHFNRITIDELKSTWMETLRQELDNDKPDLKKVLDSFSIVLLGSILAVHGDHGNDKTRYLIHSICEDIKFLVKEFSDRYESDEEKESDNEKTEEQEGTDLILPLLAIVIDWFTQIEKRLKEKKLSVGLRMVDLQTVLQLILDYINRYVDELSPFLGEKTTSDVVWYLKSPGTALPESFFYELLPKLMESAESWSLFPIYFDRYYKLLGKNQDLKAMKDMARIRLEVTENDEKLEMPKYTLFEPDAIKSKLHIIRAVVTSRQIRVFISKETIRRFDSLKSKDPDARSAVRFLEDSMKSNEIELISLDETRSSVLAKSFLSSVEGDDEFLIVTSGNSPRKRLASTDSHKIYLEGVDKFFERFSITQRKGPV
ncbi:hypothetical protein FO519_006926 [Halicephalobus sp. NKZ332]|nr:hypothetical protein FO519_006926 [Halicephalobus sp. NKZ332]